MVLLSCTGQQCSIANLPVFRDLQTGPERDRFQAIVPAYTFQCSGRVTEWRACVVPGGMSIEQYYIQFQVWRPSGSIAGCCTRVGYNIPIHDANGAVTEEESTDKRSVIDTEGFLSPSGVDGDPLRRCVELSVRDTEQIEVQQGDVVGYYVDHFSDGADRDDGGIQWNVLDANDVVLYYRADLLGTEDIEAGYALGGPNPTECNFDISGDSNSYTLWSSTNAAPIISLTVGKSFKGLVSHLLLFKLATLMPTPTQGPSDRSSPLLLTITPSPPSKPTTSSPCMPSSVSDNRCGELDVPESDAAEGSYATIVFGASVALLIISAAVFGVALILLWLRKRKGKQSKLVDVGAIKTSTNDAYDTAGTDFITTINGSYAATSVLTSQSTRKSTVEDIATSTNEAYIATGFTSAQTGDDNTTSQADNTLEYDYPRQDI